MALEKFEYWRSQKHLNLIRSMPCCSCQYQPRSQAAHSNSGKHGKGLGIKSSDEFTIPMCIYCHASFDRYENDNLTRNVNEAWFILKLIETANLLKAEGKLLPDAERLLKLRGVLE